ncbi:MAG: tRNA (adenosine(37)-N6)-threonylcarbamoyltransferase complex ATPase subunit type 1 TsaE [Candidatus Pacebacteria bacterium]|nr:tRNA (adenosine(37)-N6)-threonylcarbamoyltransferase complex ATPase subunit type 1 TsaE [Candidatus Paceibacterota bacterium]
MKSYNLSEIKKIALEVKGVIDKKSNTKEATIVTLSGDLGAGKTTLTKELAKTLGVSGDIISPTFVIMKKYKTKNLKFKNLIHIDAYRLNNSEELFNLGWSEIIKEKNNLIILEWPEIVDGCLKGGEIKVVLGHQDEKNRTLEILV